MYFAKMRGGMDTHLHIPQLLDMALGWLGAFIAILILAVMNRWLTPDFGFEFLIASFG